MLRCTGSVLAGHDRYNVSYMVRVSFQGLGQDRLYSELSIIAGHY